MKSEQVEFGERLRRALRDAGLGEGATELADLVSKYGGGAVTPQAAHAWIRGHSMPRRRNLLALAKALKVEPSLLYGEAQKTERRIADVRSDWKATAHDQHAIDTFLGLSPNRRKTVRELIALLAESDRD